MKVEVMELNEYSVSQINSKIAKLVKSEKSLSNIGVSGEISNFTNHYKTGHFYFTLKDESSSIKAVMFKNSVDSLKFKPENGSDWNGMKVVVKGDIRVFERDGQYQLYAFDMLPQGMGALYIAFLELRERLEKEGLFSQKREIPRNPATVAVITAETGAALQDILNTLSRRNPLVKVLLFPALVQGEQAPKSLIAGLSRAQSSGADVIIFGRGGGSIEDLQAFNNEDFARAVYASKIPTVSAVGHEIDFTIGDFVADLRAITPTAAAELCVADISEVYDSLSMLAVTLKSRVNELISRNFERVESLGREINAKSPKARLNVYRSQLEVLDRQIKNSVAAQISGKKQRLITEMKRVDALSPLNVLMRGYSIVTDSDGKAVTDAGKVGVGSRITVKLHKGKLITRVEEVTP
ncbi:MAG: exodeoxyribonuclease VII large subunit [Oscillospiraceae bacterium]|nr:exodeoxyribonuclease VII large subunit [Oscillospiraceae bacterium]